MSTSNHLESQFEKQQAQQQANPELNLVSLSGSSKGGESQQAHLSPESQASSTTAHAFLPKFEIGDSAAPANSEKQTATDSNPPPKPGGGSGRSGKGAKRLTGAPDWTSGQFSQSAGQVGASADSPGDTSQPTASASAGGGEGSWQARNAAPKEGFSASALSEHTGGQEGAASAEHTWSDEKATDHAAAGASTDDYNAQQQQEDSDSPVWHNSVSIAQHDHVSDSDSPVVSDESADSSTTNAPIDTFTNNSPVAETTSDEPAPIETSNANGGPVASASAGGIGTGAGSSGASQQGNSASAPAASNDAGAGIGVANAAGVSQQAANLMTSFPTVALTNSGTQTPTNSVNAATGAGANTVSSSAAAKSCGGDRAALNAAGSPDASMQADALQTPSSMDQTAAGGDASIPSATSTNASIEQQLEAQLQQIQQRLQQMSAELAQMMGGAANGSSGSVESQVASNPPSAPSVLENTSPATPTDNTPPTTPTDNTPPATPIETTPPATPTDNALAATPIETTPPATPTDNALAATPIDNTPPASVDNPTPTSPATPIASSVPADAAIGPNGNVVGSTATVFGPNAMPADAAPTGAQYYVSPDGSASGTGTEADPFATLQQAANAMAGSNIKTTDVESGTYDQSAGLTLTSADSGESFIGNGSATLNGGGTTGDLIAVNGANNVSVEGFNLTNTANNNPWSSSDWFGDNTGEDAILAQNTTGDNFSYNNINNVGMAINFQGATNSQVDGNNITNVLEGITATPGGAGNSGDNTFASNSITNVNNITNINDDSPGAINLDTDSNDTVSNNVIQNTAAAGIEASAMAMGDTITQNTVENTNTAATPSSTYNASGSDPADMGAIYAWSGAGNMTNQDLTISDNYVQNAGQGIENNGIYLDDGVTGATVTGNIVQGAGQGSASFDVLVHGGSDDTIANNILNLDSASGVEKGAFIQSDGYAMTGNSMTDNTFFASGANGGAIDTLVDSSSDNPAMSGNDYYGVPVPTIDPGATTNNPGYVSPDSGNYSLASNATAPIIADNAPPAAPSAGDNTQPVTPTDNSTPASPTDNTPPATPTDNTPQAAPTTTPVTPGSSSPPESTTDTSSTPSSLYAADMAAADAISAQPTSEASMNVGATGDPTLPANLQNLSALTINGDSGLSALSQYGTLTENSNGSCTFNGNGQQVAPLILNDVNNLTIENCVFGNTGSGGGVTFNAGNNDAVINSTFSDIGYGVGEFQSGNVDPTNMAVVNNTFSDINGPWPAASAVAFDGAGASATTAVANGQNDISHNTINDSSTNAALDGQDIISIYSYGDGGDNSQTLVSANQITGSYTPTDGSYTPDSAINAELSNDVTIAGNFITQQHNAGTGNNGSTNVDVSGNLVTDSGISYFNGPENGINPTGQWTYNNSDVTPQVAVTSGDTGAGYPELYLPGGPTNDPGNTNNWDAGGAGESTVAAPPTAPSVSDSTPPATSTPPVESSTATPVATPVDNAPPATPATTPVTPDSSASPETTTVSSSTLSSLYAADMAAADAISTQPSNPESMGVGSTGDPALPSNPANLAPLIINGDSGLSALEQYGTLTQNADGSYTFNGHNQQVAPVDLIDVDNLTVTQAAFVGAGSTQGGLTISGDSNDVVVSNSTFSGDEYGINVDESNNVDPTNIGIINNSFSNMDGLFPDGSPIQFLGAGASGTPAAPNGENLIANNTINGTEQAVGTENGIDLLSIYNYANGANNADTLVYGNSISGSLQLDGGGQTSGAGIIAELDPGTTGTPTVTAANNFVTGQTGGGLSNAGSDADFIGNLVTNSTSDAGFTAEGGYNPAGTFTYNATDNSPVVPVAQNQGGWPVVYAPNGPPNDPGYTNSWDV